MSEVDFGVLVESFENPALGGVEEAQPGDRLGDLGLRVAVRRQDTLNSGDS